MKSIIIIAALLFSANIFAQTEKKDTTTIDRNINIEKEYIPELQTVKRKNLSIITQEPSIPKANIRYSTYASGVQPKSNFYPIEAQTQNILQRRGANKGYTELGLGYPINWNVELYYPLVSNRKTLLDVHLDHWGINKGKQDFKFVNTDFELFCAQKVSGNSSFYCALDYGNDFYNYYGLTPDTVENQSIHSADVTLGIGSTEDINGWEYNIGLKYEFMYLQYLKHHEHSIDLDGYMSKMLGHNPLNIGLLLNFNYLNQPKEMNGTIGVMPSYSIIWNGLNLKIGAKVYFAINHGRIVNAMPDVTFKYDAGNILNIYGGVTGDYEINKLSSTLKECRYFDPSEAGLILNQYTPADFFLGFKVKPLAGFIIDLHANYKFIMDDHFIHNTFINNTITNKFTAEYADMQHLNVGLKLHYNYKDRITVHTGVRYNMYDIKSDTIQAWNRPEWEFEIGTEMRPVKGLTLKADFMLGTGYHSPINKELTTIENLQNHYNLNIGAGYTFKKQYTVFADLNNLLGFGKLIYQDWYGYDNVGFNFLAGIKINF